MGEKVSLMCFCFLKHVFCVGGVSVNVNADESVADFLLNVNADESGADFLLNVNLNADENHVGFLLNVSVNAN